MKIDVNKMVKLAVLSALSLVLMLLVRFPFPLARFLEYEPGDVPALIGTFLFGPLAGFAITAVVSLIQALTVSAGSGWIGALMHVIATGTMVLVAGIIYKKVHNFSGAVLALAAGCFSMTIVMVPLNLIFTPLFMGVPVEEVVKMILPVIVPFNLFKSAINSMLTVMVYKSVARVFRLQPVKDDKKAQPELQG